MDYLRLTDPSEMPELESFKHYQLSQTPSGAPLEVARNTGDLCCLAFDTQARQLVELHILEDSDALGETEVASFLGRAKEASQLRHPALPAVLDFGNDDGLFYYASEFTDGEFLGAYTRRIGGMPTGLALTTVIQVVDALIALESRPALAAGVNLLNVMLTVRGASVPQARLVDLGLTRPEVRIGGAELERQRIDEVTDLFYYLLTCEELDRGPGLRRQLESLAPNVRALMTALVEEDSFGHPKSLEDLRRAAEESLASTPSHLSVRRVKGPVALDPEIAPEFSLRSVMLSGTELVEVVDSLGGRFIMDEQPRAITPYSCHVRRAGTDLPCLLQILPPGRLIDQGNYTPIYAQMQRVKAGESDGLVAVCGLYETADAVFVVEEGTVGFTLSQLVHHRGKLEPGEANLLMARIRASLDEAESRGIEIFDLDPTNVVIDFPSRPHKHGREILLTRRLDVWPDFRVKLRAHATAPSLVSPLLVGRALEGEPEAEHKRRHRARSFAGLAAFLLTGRTPGNGGAEMLAGIEHVSEATKSLLGEYLAPPQPGIHLSVDEIAAALAKEAGAEAARAKEMADLPARGISVVPAAPPPKESKPPVEAPPMTVASPPTQPIRPAVEPAGQSGAPAVAPRPAAGITVRKVERPAPVAGAKAGQNERPPAGIPIPPHSPPQEGDDFERRQMQLTRTVRLLDVSNAQERARQRRKRNLIMAATVGAIGVFGLSALVGALAGGGDNAEDQPPAPAGSSGASTIPAAPQPVAAEPSPTPVAAAIPPTPADLEFSVEHSGNAPAQEQLRVALPVDPDPDPLIDADGEAANR